ncbi:MAG: hypothetical protein AB3N09_05710, partial [Tateyamaria sp.]
NIDLPGIAAADFNHRLVRTNQGSLLGGIRFYGHDLARPFVEVVAHSFTDLHLLAICVSSEWSAFAPLHARLMTAPGSRFPAHAFVDMSIHVARYADMALPDTRVSLARFPSVDAAADLVIDRYRNLARTQPSLAQNISAATVDDLRQWHAADQIRAIRAQVDGTETTVGLLAIAPGSVEWIEGDVVNEEVVATRHSGKGYAASAQRQWAARADIDPDRLLIGTIDGRNTASRRSAVRAGRPALLAYTFLPLAGPSAATKAPKRAHPHRR